MSGRSARKRAVSALESPPLGAIDKALALQKPNPFDLPPDTELFTRRDQQLKDQKAKQAMVMNQSIVDRTMSCLPPLHNQTRAAGRSTTDVGGAGQIAPPIAQHEQRYQLSEFVDQRREIFLVALLIDRKNKEIERIQNMRKTEKKIIVEDFAKIAETSNQYKMSTNQYEAELARGKRSMDAAIRRCKDLSNEFKKKSAFVSVLESEILRNEETLYAYRTYSEFIKNLTPHGQDPTDYFKTTDVLLEELEKVENENLFLVRQCQELRDEQESGLQTVQGMIDGTDKESGAVIEAMKKLHQIDEVSEHNTSVVSKECDTLDSLRKRLANMVTKTYRHCFGESADVNTLTRLERIENELEKMYEQSSMIGPAFILAKQTEKDKARRDVLRREKTEKQEKEAKRKLEAALARAQMPIKRRTGRPLLERALPIKLNRNPVDEKKKLLEEQERDAFLYGEITD